MGFGPRGTEGKIAAVRYAREEKVPFFGICFGMQMAVIEFARHVCGLDGRQLERGRRAHAASGDRPDAEPAHGDAQGRHDAARRLPVRARRALAGGAAVRQDARSASAIATATSSTTPTASSSTTAGLILSGLSPDGSSSRSIELADHPWFIGCQFHPEFKSRPLDCHPLFKGFIRAALQHKAEAARRRC